MSCWSDASSDTDAHSQLPNSDNAGRNKRTTRLREQQQRTFRNAAASSFRVKFATAGVLSGKSFRSAYSRTFAMINSENCTRSPGSPAVPRLSQKWQAKHLQDRRRYGTTSLFQNVLAAADIGAKRYKGKIVAVSNSACPCIAKVSRMSFFASHSFKASLTDQQRAPDMQISLWLSIGTSLSSSCLMVMICCDAQVSLHTITKSLPLIPKRKSMAARQA